MLGACSLFPACDKARHRAPCRAPSWAHLQNGQVPSWEGWRSGQPDSAARVLAFAPWTPDKHAVLLSAQPEAVLRICLLGPVILGAGATTATIATWPHRTMLDDYSNRALHNYRPARPESSDGTSVAGVAAWSWGLDSACMQCLGLMICILTTATCLGSGQRTVNVNGQGIQFFRSSNTPKPSPASMPGVGTCLARECTPEKSLPMQTKLNKAEEIHHCCPRGPCDDLCERGKFWRGCLCRGHSLAPYSGLEDRAHA